MAYVLKTRPTTKHGLPTSHLVCASVARIQDVAQNRLSAMPRSSYELESDLATQAEALGGSHEQRAARA